MTCYTAALPFMVWAVLISFGVDADATRVPFLVCEAAAVVVSITGLRRKYRDSDHV